MYDRDAPQQEWLDAFVDRVGAVAGTVHVQRGDDLYLTAAHNIPPPVIAAVAHVPRGKGMAGIAQVTRAPVQTCNLQADASGTVKPGAKAVDAGAAIALPVLDGGDEVRAVVGVAWPTEREIPADEEAALLLAATGLPEPEPELEAD